MTIVNVPNTVDLSPMDAVMTNIGVMILYIYKPTQNHSYNLEILKASFVETLNQDYPILNGELHIDSERCGMLYVKLDPNKIATAAPFVTDLSCPQTTDQALESLSYDFMPPAREGQHQLITTKASVLSDGGLVIGLDFAHGVLDGEAAFTFVKVWARRYRRLTGTPPNELGDPIKLNHDRRLLSGHGKRTCAPHPEFRVYASTGEYLKLEAGPIPVPVNDPPSTAQRIFHLSPDMLGRLKKLATESTTAPDYSYVSTIDSLTALLIVLITQARGHGKDVRVATCVNARAHLHPPLPTNYVGNATFFALPTYKAAELASDNLVDTLCLVARRVRESIVRTRDDQFLRDSMAFVSSQPDMSAVGVSTDFFFGPDLFFTSWVRMGAYDADFGGGKASYAGLPRLPVTDGLVVIADPMYPEQDGLDVTVSLESKAMEAFRDHWQSLAL
ncbi:hypothetical protein AM588_10004886 [Phytophthora nicotianae]|uniref:Uncharacterized protein n=1 Tax=Phytophthora nicotianae TaxID=4792 RepID=A0A0W8DEG2_PHYNI|nr:hypothetical protein AM588_10004886 [Phytophthora nicotianae]